MNIIKIKSHKDVNILKNSYDEYFNRKDKTVKLNIIPLLTLIFIILKLTGVIRWSWWWVVSPLLFGIGLAITIMLIILIIAFIKSKTE